MGEFAQVYERPRPRPVVCGCDAEADTNGAPRLHPRLAVLLCKKCLDRHTRAFDVDVSPTPVSLSPRLRGAAAVGAAEGDGRRRAALGTVSAGDGGGGVC